MRLHLRAQQPKMSRARMTITNSLDKPAMHQYLIHKPTGRSINNMPRKENLENIAKRKEQIVKAAISAFARKGLKNTSMNDIVRESGLSKGAIYWYYKSKDEIISELLKEFFDPEEIRKVQGMLSTGSASQRLDRFIEYIANEMNKMRRFRPVIQELFVIAFRDQKIRMMTKRNFQASVSLLQSIIDEGIRTKEFESVDSRQATLAIFEIIESTALFWSLDFIEVDFEEQLRGGVNLILTAIKRKK